MRILAESDGAHLGELGGGALGDLSNAKGGELVAEVIEVLEEVLARLGSQFVGLHYKQAW